MTDLRQAAQMALEALENSSPDQYPEDAGVFYDAKEALRTALEQQAEPREGFEKWAKAQPNYMDISRFEAGYSDCNTDYAWAGWQAALAQPQQQAEPVSVRMPKVGDRVICLEDESLGEVVSLTAGGSPDIKFDDGSRGTYMLSEFAELFGYVTAAQLDKTSFGAWWDGDYDDSENPFEQDSAAYWAWAGWQAAKRPWQGLTDDEMKATWSQLWHDLNHGKLSAPDNEVRNNVVMFGQALEAKLKERNT